MPRKDSWAILPATMTLLNKRKTTIDECATVWGTGAVLVCTNEQGRTCFIAGAQGSYGVKPGDRILCHHDQTLANKGWYTINNIVHFRRNADTVVLESELPYDRSTKASLAVLK